MAELRETLELHELVQDPPKEFLEIYGSFDKGKETPSLLMVRRHINACSGGSIRFNALQAKWVFKVLGSTEDVAEVIGGTALVAWNDSRDRRIVRIPKDHPCSYSYPSEILFDATQLAFLEKHKQEILDFLGQTRKIVKRALSAISET